MPTKRHHKKTRTGCKQCKEKRLKCDEIQPVCTRCERRGERCSYLECSLVVISSYTGSQAKTTKAPLLSPSNQQDVTIAFATPQTQHSNGPRAIQTNNRNRSPTSASATAPIQIQIERHQQKNNSIDLRFSSPATLKDDCNDKLRLIHHFTLNTSSTMADQIHTPAWQHSIPTLAFSHPFLLSGLLAITSLHLSLVSPSAVQTKITLKHHTEALKLFRPELQHITPENANALFVFTVLIPVFALGARNTSMGNPDAIAGICEIFTLMKGTGIVVMKGGAWLNGVLFEAQFLPIPSFGLGTLLPATVDKSLLSLSSRNEELNSGRDEEGYEVYKQAIGTLMHSFLLANESPRAKIVMLPFPIFGPAGFVGRLRDGEELALAVVAHYAVLLFWLREDLWLRNWGEDIILEVKRRIGGKWKECIAWPVVEVEKGNFAMSKD